MLVQGALKVQYWPNKTHLRARSSPPGPVCHQGPSPPKPFFAIFMVCIRRELNLNWQTNAAHPLPALHSGAPLSRTSALQAPPWGLDPPSRQSSAHDAQLHPTPCPTQPLSPSHHWAHQVVATVRPLKNGLLGACQGRPLDKSPAVGKWLRHALH